METTKSLTIGYPPTVVIGKAQPRENPEKAKYQALWKDHADYRTHSPAEAAVQDFIRQAKPKRGETVLDLGCGTGRASFLMCLFAGVKVTLVDFVPDALDEDVRNALTTQAHALSFVEADLEKEIPVRGKYGFCVDVLEHIPPEKVDTVLRNILNATENVFLQISTVPDHFGQVIGEKLHLTVEKPQWWLNKLRSLGFIVYYANDLGGAVQFYGTAWSVRQLVDRGGVNTGEEEILRNVAHACDLIKDKGYAQARPYERQEAEIMIIGGGPSLADFWPEIIEKRQRGMPMVCINGTYNEALQRGLKPSAQIVVDAREFNQRFTRPTVDGCKYLLASQCHPAVFEGVPQDQVTIWHSVIGENRIAQLLDARLGENFGWFPVPGGSTAMLRSFCLLRMLGFYKFHVYGFDSCLREKQHHAYEQKENDEETVIEIVVPASGRKFYCHPWMASQAQEFIDEVRMLGDEVQMHIYGDGLIAHIIETGAQEVEPLS